MKKQLLIMLITVSCLYTQVQNLEINYGTIMGLNTSFIHVNSEVSPYYLFHENDANFKFMNTSQSKVGYEFGRTSVV